MQINKNTILLFLLMLTMFIFPRAIFAEPSTMAPSEPSVEIDQTAVQQGQQLMPMSNPTLPISYLIPIFLILFGGLVILVQYKYLSVVKPNPDVSLPTFSLTLIITGTLVIVSSGMNEKILGTAVGLFGTIAGYVLGRATNYKQDSSNRPDDK